jgi:hypothetical protein
LPKKTYLDFLLPAWQSQRKPGPLSFCRISQCSCILDLHCFFCWEFASTVSLSLCYI